jgi:GNAT superfamily N-acetyltransferase
MEINTLTKEIALNFTEEIIQLHNLIPFQHWSKEDLFLERDHRRIFKYKWEVSSVCFIEKVLCGICVAFEDNQSAINDIRDFLYIHRIVVDPKQRFKGVGTRLMKYTCNNFDKINSLDANTSVIVLTPIEATSKISFDNAEEFYLKLGFNRIGVKKDENKIDAILKVSLNNII